MELMMECLLPRTAVRLVVLTLVACAHTAASQTYDQPPLRKATEIVPEGLASGEHYRVLDDIRVYDSIYLFTIQSDFGEFLPDGELMLRIRLREIGALEVLAEIKGSRVAAESAGRVASDGVKTVGEFAARPGKTIRGIPGGISRRFKTVKRDINEGVQAVKDSRRAAGPGDSSDLKKEATRGVYRWYFGIDRAERRWAQKLGVDPYSTNEALQAEIARVGKIDAMAGKGTGFLVPKIPYAGYVKEVLNVVWTTDPRELEEANRKRLTEAGISQEIIDAFFQVTILTPTTRTLLVSTVLDLEGVTGLEVVFEQAMTLESEPEALFFIESVLMAAWYHLSEAPLDTMLGITGIPVAVTADGRLLAFTAADHIYWTEDSAAVTRDFVAAYEGRGAVPEVWISGQASDLFVAEVKKLGWIVRTGVRAQLLPLIPWSVTGTDQ